MTLQNIDRLRRAGGGALRLLVDLLPVELHPERRGADVEEEIGIVFADVADYSDFVAGAGDDAAMTVLEILDELVGQGLEGSHARLVKRLGDG